jgi:RNA-binding protein YhbY
MGSGGDDAGVDRVVSVLLVVRPDAESDAEVGERLARRLRAELVELRGSEFSGQWFSG